MVPVLSETPGTIRNAGSARPGQHNDEVYRGLLGKTDAEMDRAEGGGGHMSELPEHVDIREVALRDGLQIEDPIPLSAKVEDARGDRRHRRARRSRPPRSSPRRKVPALADAAELAAELANFRDAAGVEFSALVASPNGAKRAIAAGLQSIEYVVSAADGHSRANVGRSTAEAVALIADIVAIAHDSGATVEVIIATAWDCPFDGPTPPQRVLDIVSAARDNGADRLAIADTIGTTTPRRVTDLVAQVRPLIGDIPLGAHFHNTRGAGLASAYAAVCSGITRLDASVGGLGGCPFAPGASGNIATEDLVYLLRDSGIHVDVDLNAADRGGRGRAGRGRTRAARRAAPRRRPARWVSERADVDCADAEGPPDPARHRAGGPESCSPSAVFTAPRWPTSRRPRVSHRRCSTAISTTRRTCWPRWPSRSCATS